VGCGSEPFHADFTIRRDDDTDGLAVDLGHKPLQYAPRLYADGFGSLKADAFRSGIVVVTMEGEIYLNLVQRKGSARAHRHDNDSDSGPPVSSHAFLE